MEPLCRVAFDMSEADAIAAGTRAMLRGPRVETTYRRNRQLGMAAVAVAACVFAVGGYLSASDRSAGMALAAMWLVIFGFLWPVFAGVLLTRRATRRRVLKKIEGEIRSGWTGSVAGPCEVLVYPDRLEVRERGQLVSRNWAAVRGVSREADGVYVEFAEGQPLRVPARAFGTEAEMIRLIDEVERREGRRD